MREGWKEYKIEDIALVGDGAHASIKRQETGVMYLTSKNFDVNGLKLDKVDYISEIDFIKYFNSNSKALTKPNYNDVVLSIIGSMGAPYVVKKNDDFGLSSSVSILRPNQEIILPNYLYYWIKSDFFQKSIDNIKSGVAQSFLSLGMIKSLPCNAPSLKIQRKIAAILSSYDDLIQNNLKRIKLLEEKAQLTYEEWFVKMRFPGYETAKFDEVMGLPEGWSEKTLEYLCDRITDGTHDSPKQVENGIKLITGKHINDGFINFETAYLISEIDHEKIKKRSGLSKGDLLFSNIGTLGSIGVVTEDFEYSCKNVVIFKKKKGFDYFLYCYLSNPNTKNKLDNQAAGVAQKFYSLSFIRGYKDMFCNEELVIRFNGVMTPLFNLKYSLNNQNRLLKEARDILLPRLMSGMIDVEELQIETLQTT
ncbi:type I restriction enzyme S subunit [Flavobacterium sp. CG_23.5]|uniref:restriction endonuclease subunit S n=1 Tax=Flavobacterium sp. CG_23.5 TaxID=2760708 RepID=UPI001AE4C825|nr:restriction endonuclease subunit S [Flavobacterium sp. CG_23.5]MBP2281696.1 type I restriction enzyme S subunit [Flavobacterium sp. CG_23.5]